MITKAYHNINGHKVFDTSMQDKDYNKDYDMSGFVALFENEERHFWFIARKELIKKVMNRYINKNAKIIEVGAGTGNVTKSLM